MKTGFLKTGFQKNLEKFFWFFKRKTPGYQKLKTGFLKTGFKNPEKNEIRISIFF